LTNPAVGNARQPGGRIFAVKVVLFCGGMGMRIREYSDFVPKPMVPIGYRPLLWHVMKYYAHFGHKEFILCLGYKADVVKDYFLNYDECVSNNFVLSNGGRKVQLINSDIHDWNITFVDTGISSNIGQRLKAVEPYLKGESAFLANYSDGLTDLPLPKYLDHFYDTNKVGCFLAVTPSQSYHVVSIDGNLASGLCPLNKTGILINGGFFAFRTEIFNYIKTGEELVEQPFLRLIEEKQLVAYRYDGFWTCMDTFKDKHHLDELYNRGDAPWEVWKAAEQVSNDARWRLWTPPSKRKAALKKA
jgi:glucose-1-phosphate cytidylyltransferase